MTVRAIDVACGVTLNDGRALEQASPADEVQRIVSAVMDRAMAEIEAIPVSASLYQSKIAAMAAQELKNRALMRLHEYTYGQRITQRMMDGAFE